MLENNRANVLIVGGGLAGLTAAKFFKEHGLNPLVLEADDRLGGRIQTVKVNRFEVEMGGEFVGADHREMKQLCRESKLELVPYKFNPAVKVGDREFWEGGRLVDHSRHINDLVKSAPQTDEYLASISFLEFLKESGVTKKDLIVADIRFRFSYARDTSSQSALSVIRDLREGVSAKEDSLCIKGGNIQLIDRLAGIVGEDAIKLNSKVKTINQSEDGVEVFCADGTTYKSDYAVVALPTHAVLDIEFQPQLPREKREALKAVSYTKITKMSALFRSCCWGDDFELLQNGNPDALYHTSLGQEGEGAILMAYIIHEHVEELDHLDETQRRKLVYNLLKDRFPARGKSKKVISYPIRTEIARWPHAFSSYDRGDYDRIAAELKQPWINIFWAGEHIPEKFKEQGYFEGAVISGRQAAEQILQMRSLAA